MSGEMAAEPGEATLAAGLEVQADGTAVSHALDFTGCYATGATPEEALARLVEAIPAYFAWLRLHDEYTPTGTTVGHPTVAERHQVTSATPGAGEATFTADRAPLSGEDLDWYLALLGWALEDLTARPQTPAAYAHVSGMLDATLATLGLAPATPFASGPQPALDTYARQLRALPADQLGQEAHHGGVTWTPRKALRWGITHARAHTAS